jgi:SAM-dependent methyltransferase
MTAPRTEAHDAPAGSVRLSAPPSQFGMGTALHAGYAALRAISDGLRAHAERPTAAVDEPFHLESSRLALLTYREALSAVRRRFWTTTSLTSEFWSGERNGVVSSNQRLLANVPSGSGAVRRLFLLTAPPDVEVRRRRDERALLRKHDDVRGLAEFDRRIATLRMLCEAASAHDCELRAAYDAAPRYDGELAVYDDWRFDVFLTTRSGTILSVDVHTPAMRGFAERLDRAVDYFGALWRDAQPLSELLDRIDAAVAQGDARIDYHPIWLARYEHDLPAEDESLKRAEAAALEAELRRHGLWRTLRRVLDVGTCTGRYPIRLREGVALGGEIVGVDNDEDAVRFARRNVAAAGGGDARIRIEQLDFCAPDAALTGPFDLITCMLGTLAHFARDRAAGEPFRDDLQRALERFASLLAAGGVLFFSIWTDRARREGRVLSIYSDEDKRRLASWDVSADELERRLRAAGLRVQARAPLEERMELYCCARAG